MHKPFGRFDEKDNYLEIFRKFSKIITVLLQSFTSKLQTMHYF